MKDVFVLVSNGWYSYYKSKANRDSDEISQDYSYTTQITEEEYEKFEVSFEDYFVKVGNTAYLDGVTPVEITRIDDDGRIYVKKTSCLDVIWVRFRDLHKELK